MKKTVIGGLAAGVLAVLGCSLAGAAAASPPGPGDPGYCGAHTSPWDCWSDVSPARPGEAEFFKVDESSGC